VPSAPLQVTVTNTAGPAETVGSTTVGGEPLHLSGLAIVGADGGDYQITAPSCASIPAQGSCTIEVTFTPTATGNRPATLQFSSNDRTQAAPVSVALDGNGIARTSSTTVRCPPGTTTVGATLTCTLTVSDTDIAPASTPTGSVALSSDSAGAVGNPGNCMLVATGAAGHASCSLTYTPSALGTGQHTLTAAYCGVSEFATERSHFSTQRWGCWLGG
jgi:hypothetical protein